jgi:hypothetical protein
MADNNGTNHREAAQRPNELEETVEPKQGTPEAELPRLAQEMMASLKNIHTITPNEGPSTTIQKYTGIITTNDGGAFHFTFEPAKEMVTLFRYPDTAKHPEYPNGVTAFIPVKEFSSLVMDKVTFRRMRACEMLMALSDAKNRINIKNYREAGIGHRYEVLVHSPQGVPLVSFSSRDFEDRWHALEAHRTSFDGDQPFAELTIVADASNNDNDNNKKIYQLLEERSGIKRVELG